MLRNRAPGALFVAVTASGCLGTQGATPGTPPVGTIGPGACLITSPSNLDFPGVVAGTSAFETVQLSNRCLGTVTAIQAAVGGQDGNLFDVQSVPPVLASAASVNVSVAYSPQAAANRSFGMVTFSSPDSSDAILGLFGNAIASALQLASSAIDFGFVNPPGSITSCLPVQNQAATSVDIAGIGSFMNPGGAFQLAQSSNAFPLTLLAGGTAELCFSFAPTATQQYEGAVTLLTTSTSGGTVSVGLSGWGGGPLLRCSPLTLDFGPQIVGTSEVLPILCQNAGTEVPGVALQIDEPNISPAVFTAGFDRKQHPYSIAGLQPGDVVQLDVGYAPDRAASDRGSMLIQSNGGQIQIPLAGEGFEVADCQAVIDPPALDFGNLVAGNASETLGFKIENRGSHACVVQDLGVLDDPTGSFSIVSTSLAPDPETGKILLAPLGSDPGSGSSRLAVEVKFEPVGPGSFSGAIPFYGTTVPLSGTDEGTCLEVLPSAMRFGPGSQLDAGPCAFGSKAFSVVNKCGVPASVQALSVQAGAGDDEAQFAIEALPGFPVALEPGAGLRWLVKDLANAGTHSGEILVSDGQVESTLLLLSTCP